MSARIVTITGMASTPADVRAALTGAGAGTGVTDPNVVRIAGPDGAVMTVLGYARVGADRFVLRVTRDGSHSVEFYALTMTEGYARLHARDRMPATTRTQTYATRMALT